MRDQYTRTEWIDGQTKISSEKLNNIEAGIENLFENALTVSEIYGNDGIAVDIINGKNILIHTKKGYYLTTEQVKNAIAQAQLYNPETGEGLDLTGKADVSSVYTKEELDEKVAKLEETLEKYAENAGLVTGDIKEAIENLKTEILEKGYLTEHQSLENYVTKEDLEAKKYLTTHQDISGKLDTSTAATTYATKTEVNNKSDITHRHALGDITGLPVGTLATESFVKSEITKAQLEGEEVDLTPFLTKDVADNTYQPKGDYLTEHQSLENYVTKENLESKGYLTEHQDISGKADKTELFDKDYNKLLNLPEIPSVNGLATTDYVNTAIANAQLEEKEIDLTDYLKRSDVSNVAITGRYVDLLDAPNTDDYLTLSEADQKYVKTVSINGGEKFNVDATGNVDVTYLVKNSITAEEVDTKISEALEGFSGAGGLTQDMIEYLNTKLTYTYNYSCSVTGTSTIELPSSSISVVTFIATPGVTKKNDSGNKPIEVSAVTCTTPGWWRSGKAFVKEVTLDKTQASVSSGTISVSITDSDGKTGVATGKCTVLFEKPWYIFNGDTEHLENPGELIEGLISCTIRSKLYDWRSINEELTLDITRPYLWFIIPNTRSMGSVDQIAGLSAIDFYNSATSSLGTYMIYKWKGGLASGHLTFNLKIN